MSRPMLKSKKRLLFLMALIIVMFAGVAAKMAYIVFAQGEQLQEMALIQQTKDLLIEAQRGSILDRNGNVLAQSANADTVVLRPAEVAKGNVDSIVSVLSEMLGIDEETVRRKATDMSKSEVWLARQIGNKVSSELRKLNLPGVYFMVETKRFYPNSAFLTQTLGFTSVDGVGIEGIEAYYEPYLSGQPGRIVSETDVAGREIPLAEKDFIAPVDGLNVVLTIDEVIQSFLEKALELAYTEQNAQSAYGIVMDPQTGQILAMESIPDYDLNNIPNEDMDALTAMSANRVLADVFEPGSTLEVITQAAALDSGAITRESEFDCNGYVTVQGQLIKCWQYPQAHGHINVFEAAQSSCNSAFIDMGIAMGTETFYDYIYEFGYGQPTGITFPSDQGGSVMAEKYVQQSDLARMAFGQSIAVSPLQLVSSISAVVNGGFLFKPQLVKQLQDSEGVVYKTYEPQVVSQPISEQTSALMREILQSVVTFGSGRDCYIPGYSVGGKTGTAQKYDDDGQIIPDKHIASFVGFAPADNPQVIVLIVVDEPDVPFDFSSTVAAPYVKDVLLASLQYMGVEQQFQDETEPTQIVAPNLVGLERSEAAMELTNIGLKYLSDGEGIVTGQIPETGAMMEPGTTVLLLMDTKNTAQDLEGKVIVPNLEGLSIMEISQVLQNYGLKLVIEGAGTATYQSPAAGEIVQAGSEIIVEFRVSSG
ncbi:MAG: PASTA domain-containing protein [Clostridia bacterium]|nr:PASTA domain-containing protein [Clostridia bacterium]